MMMFGNATADHHRYRLWDYTDGYGVVGYYDTLEDAQEMADEWYGDVDGDCDLAIQEWNDDVQAYVPLD